MRKSIKKIISILIVISLLFSIFSISTFAANVNLIGTEEIIVINEWDEYKRIVSMSDAELLAMGYTSDEVAEIRAFDYEEEIRKTAELDDETLITYGYTNEEILALRKAASMEEIPENVIQTISSSTMTTTLRYVSSGSRIEAGKTMYYVNMKFSWSWSRIPVFRLVDMVAIGYNSPSSSNFSYYATSNNKVHANLMKLGSGGDEYIQQTESWTYSVTKPNSISAEFMVGMKDSSGNLTHFAYSGYGTFQLTNRSNDAMLYIDAAYGHIIISIKPSYSVSYSGETSGAIGIEFTTGIDEQHCTGQFYEDFTISRNYIYHGTVYGKNNTGGQPIS